MFRVYWLLLLFLCAITTANSQEGIQEADALMNRGLFKQAGLTYAYIYWQSSDPSVRAAARLGKVRALKGQKRYAEAGELLQATNLLRVPPKFRQDLVYEQVLLEYLEGDYPSALSKGMFGRSVFTDTLENEVYTSYLLLLSFSAYKNDQWELGHTYARRYLAILSSGSEDDYLEKFNELTTRNHPELKSPKKAALLSLFLPGTGQMYAGDAGGGLTSLGLHIAGLGGATLAAFSGFYVTAWLGAALVVQRVYAGGRERAVALVEKRNRLEKDAFLQPIYELLLSFTPALYPST